MEKTSQPHQPNNRTQVLRKNTPSKPLVRTIQKPTQTYGQKFYPKTAQAGVQATQQSPQKTSHQGQSRPPYKKDDKKKRPYKRNSRQAYRALQTIKKNDKLSFEITRKQREAVEKIPPLAPGDVRVVPICGTNGIGSNMNMIEYNDQIVIIDAGFGFSDPSIPGVDYTIPNIAYLQYHKAKIKGLVITHAHLDHVGGIPYILEALGNPTIYTPDFGAMFIKKKLAEFPHLAKIANIHVVDMNAGYITLSEDMKVKFFGLTHSIPDSSGVIVQTPLGGVVSTGDVRVENKDGIPAREEVEGYEFFKDENILMLLMDSTNIENPGWSLCEADVAENIDKMIKGTMGRLYISAFSSQVERLMQFMESAKRHGKYVVLEGRSIKNNLGIAQHLKLTGFDHVIPIADIDKYPDNKLLILITGSQGEEFSALNRVANNTHKYLKFRASDTVVLSSSIVPGNHHPVTQMKNMMYRGSYNIITYKDSMVHSSGHGNREELKWIHGKIPHKFFMPVHGEPYMVRMHAQMKLKHLGFPAERMAVPDDGTIVEIRNGGEDLVVLAERTPHELTVVDGSYVGPLHKVVMDDRMALSEDGMFVVVVSIDVKRGKLKKSPDIISRGFIYLRESREFLNEVRNQVKRNVETFIRGKKHIDFDEVKNMIAHNVGRQLLQETHKEPIIIPVVLGV